MTQIVDAQGNEVENQEPEQEIQKRDIKDLDCGYLVGLEKDGKFVFDIFGQNPTLVSLMGLHKHAEKRIDLTSDISQNTGLPILMKQVAQIGQMLEVLLNMVTDQAKNSIQK